MKKISFLLMTLLSFLLSSYSCDREGVCKAVYLADLTLEAFIANFEFIQDNQEFYELSHSVINFVDDLTDCSENVKPANANTFLQSIAYSPTADLANSILVDELELPLAELGPGKIGELIDNLAFLVDGYYSVTSKIDINNDVEERNENNNLAENPLGRSRINFEQVIFVQGTKHKHPRIGPNGKNEYLKRISTRVVYH